MKTKKSSELPVKIFLVVVGVILVGLIIAWAMGVFKEKKKEIDNSTERINRALSSMAEFDILVLDGSTINGDLLLEILKEKYVEKTERFSNIAIQYYTLKDSKTAKPTDTSGITKDNYKEKFNDINLNGVFEGTVERDENGIINKIIFRQKKL